MSIPTRVQAAIKIIEWASGMKFANNSNGFGEQSQIGETVYLSMREQILYESAIEAVRLYLSGEMDYGDCPPLAEVKETDEEECANEEQESFNTREQE